HVPAAGGEGFGTPVQGEAADLLGTHQAAQGCGGLEEDDAGARPGACAGGGQSGHSPADDGDVVVCWVHCSCAQVTSRVSTSGSVPGGTPWPRLSTWAGATR